MILKAFEVVYFVSSSNNFKGTEMKIQSLSSRPHADGKFGDVSLSTKHFWSVTTKLSHHSAKQAKHEMDPYILFGVIQIS